MPIRPEMRDQYPADWDEISWRIRDRAGWKCEGSPAFPKCRAVNRQPHPETGSIVVLTVAHFDHDVSNGADSNLFAWCQRCHLTHDGHQHRQQRIKKQHADAGTVDVFESEPTWDYPELAARRNDPSR
jgi:hypothetical protein